MTEPGTRQALGERTSQLRSPIDATQSHVKWSPSAWLMRRSRPRGIKQLARDHTRAKYHPLNLKTSFAATNLTSPGACSMNELTDLSRTLGPPCLACSPHNSLSSLLSRGVRAREQDKAKSDTCPKEAWEPRRHGGGLDRSHRAPKGTDTWRDGSPLKERSPLKEQWRDTKACPAQSLPELKTEATGTSWLR